MIARADSRPPRARGRPLGPVLIAVAALTLLVALVGSATAQSQASFRKFLEELWPEAKAFGIRRTTYDAALKGVDLDTTLPDLVLPGKEQTEPRGQAEFTRTPSEYLNTTQLARLAEQGIALKEKHAAALAKIEREIGVQGHYVLAIWGRETAFGHANLQHYAIQVLANEAYLGRRKDMFRNELLHALKMLDAGVITRDKMKSSWAGAMGLTQFMPSEYFTTAYDLDGDGKKDIWNSVPDALASAANQLKQKGWVAGQTWGYEVVVPKNFNFMMANRSKILTIREWEHLGIRRAGDKPFPRGTDRAFLMIPAGSQGPGFLMLNNFRVIMRYNPAEAYALAIGHLSDRLRGAEPFLQPWPRHERVLSRDERMEMQQLLVRRGFDIGEPDGNFGPKTRAAIRDFQARAGLVPDGFPTATVLAKLRGN